MTVGDLKFDPAKHLVNGKLRPPDKCEQLFVVHFSNRLAKNRTILWSDARAAVYLLYQQWWFGWREEVGEFTTVLEELDLFARYWKDNMPEGYGGK